MQTNLTPDYLSSLVSDTVGNNTAYNLRNSQNLNTSHANSQLYYKSFLPSVTRDWNRLSDEIRNLPSLSSFKRHLNSNLLAPPKYFCDGNRPGQIYHARLWMKCSALNQHLFSKHIVDSPLCVCGYFLFSCTRYANLQQELLNKTIPLCQSSLNVFLNGDRELSDSTNKQIFLAVQDFLIKTERFEVK